MKEQILLFRYFFLQLFLSCFVFLDRSERRSSGDCGGDGGMISRSSKKRVGGGGGGGGVLAEGVAVVEIDSQKIYRI